VLGINNSSDQTSIKDRFTIHWKISLQWFPLGFLGTPDTMVKHWIPLESNPEVLNEFASKLGVTTIPAAFSFCDIFGLDDELLGMVPSPVLAVLLLFPITPETEQLRKEGKKRERKREGELLFQYKKPTTHENCSLHHSSSNFIFLTFYSTEAEQLKASNAPTNPDTVFYMKQTIGNACGTIGLLHCVANSKSFLNLKEGSFMEQFLKDTVDLTPDARGKHLEEPPAGAMSIDAIHEVGK
jgi:ubiquitin carboxyl-terminal hydrolase L3